MEKRKISSESFFRMLLILFGAMLTSQLSMVGIFIYLSISGQITPEPHDVPELYYLVPIVACTGFGLSFLLPAKLVANAAQKPTLGDKLRGYQTAFIIRLSMLEAPALLGCIALYLTGGFDWLIVNAIALPFFWLAMPTKEKVIEALHLSGPEIELVNDPKAIVMEYDTTDD